MNREIEFRAKRKDNDEWVYGFYSQFHNRPTNNEPNSHQIFEVLSDEKSIRLAGTSIGGIWHIVDEATLGQYVGLKDKNGTKIFEGDILKHFYSSIEIYGFYENLDVFYEEGKFFGGCYDLWDVACSSEIIGNIYDNPELLQQTE